MTTLKYFGTDGIRGRVGQEPIMPETILKLGWALGQVVGGDNPQSSKVLIGKDTRVSGYLLESALEAGLAAAGVNVLLTGPIPTPGLAYLTRTARASAGVVISASHNPYQDNGIKFFSPAGTKLDDELESKIEAMMDQPLTIKNSTTPGKAERFPDAASRYIEFCKSVIPHRSSLKGLKIVVDCANGAGYHIAPDVFAELGATVVAIANHPDGYNINRESGSTHPAALQQKVLDEKADLGMGLDGDGDRVMLVDHRGHLVDGDQILYILALYRHRTGTLNGGVVGTLMTNLALEQALAHEDIDFTRSAVGDRHVLKILQQRQWELGGENSGHIISLDRTTTGDGIIATLLVLLAMTEQDKRLDELASGMSLFPQNLVNVTLTADSPRADTLIQQSTAITTAVHEAEQELADQGRVLLRPSGTEPLIRVMVEGRDANQVDRISHQLAAVVTTAAQK